MYEKDAEEEKNEKKNNALHQKERKERKTTKWSLPATTKDKATQSKNCNFFNFMRHMTALQWTS